MGELWKVFYDSKTGEEQATRELLAFEKGIPAEQIRTEIERRATK